MITTEHLGKVIDTLREKGVQSARIIDESGTIEVVLGSFMSPIDESLAKLPNRNICACGHHRSMHTPSCIDCPDSKNCDSIEG